VAGPLRSSLFTVAVSLVVGAAGGAGADYYLHHAAALGTSRPPIAVLDLSAAALNLPREGDAATLVNARIERLRAAAEMLKNAGWIVLDAQAVIGAPESLYVPLDVDR
jgi:hypothetical protein